MIRSLKPFLLLPIVSLFSSCSDLETPNAQLASEVGKNLPKAQELHYKGDEAEKKGDLGDAAKYYDLLSIRYPSYDKAPELNYKAAQYWESENKPVNAFDSYQNYIQKFRNGVNYQSALDRQSGIAYSAAKGGLNKKFLGLKQEPQYSDVVEMLVKVSENAPASDIAARALFAVGTYSESKKKNNEAVAAYFKVVDTYPTHSLAPEATYRAGKALSGYTEEGNQNSSNLNRARTTLEDLIQQYPGTTQARDARNLLSQISGTDAQRTFDIASFYEKKGKISSAKYYFQEVVNKAGEGSELSNKAQQRINALQ